MWSHGELLGMAVHTGLCVLGSQFGGNPWVRLPVMLFLERLYKSQIGPETSAKNHCGFSWDQVGYDHPYCEYAHMYVV